MTCVKKSAAKLTIMATKAVAMTKRTIQAMKTNRNHVAKALWTPRFRPQKTKNTKAYTRKVKHKVKYA